MSMSGINKIILLGNVGKDPDIRTLEGGVMVASFPLATNENFRDKASGELKTQTEWHNIVMWRNVAQSLEKSKLQKGDRVYLEGKIKTRKWTDRDSQERIAFEIVADTFTVINRKRVATEAGEVGDTEGE